MKEAGRVDVPSRAMRCVPTTIPSTTKRDTAADAMAAGHAAHRSRWSRMYPVGACSGDV